MKVLRFSQNGESEYEEVTRLDILNMVREKAESVNKTVNSYVRSTASTFDINLHTF